MLQQAFFHALVEVLEALDVELEGEISRKSADFVRGRGFGVGDRGCVDPAALPKATRISQHEIMCEHHHVCIRAQLM